jgi:hypothetical protein
MRVGFELEEANAKPSIRCACGFFPSGCSNRSTQNGQCGEAFS